MSEKLGFVGFGAGFEETYLKPYSEETEKIIDEEVRNIVNDCTEKTRVILTGKKEFILKVAEFLIQNERIVHTDLIQLLGPRPFEHKEGYQRYLEIKKHDEEN